MSRDLIIEIARNWIGTPYIHQASVRGVGCDCLGLLRGVWREVLGSEPCIVPPYSADWAEAGGRETLAEAGCKHLIEIPVSEFTTGDVILFRWREHLPAKHCAIAVSKERMMARALPRLRLVRGGKGISLLPFNFPVEPDAAFRNG